MTVSLLSWSPDLPTDLLENLTGGAYPPVLFYKNSFLYNRFCPPQALNVRTREATKSELTTEFCNLLKFIFVIA